MFSADVLWVSTSGLAEVPSNVTQSQVLWACLPGSHQTGQNKQPQFIVDEVFSTPSGIDWDLYQHCELFSSELPPNLGAGDGIRVS